MSASAIAPVLPTIEVLAGTLSSIKGTDWDAIAVPVAPAGAEPAAGVQPRAGAADAATLYGIDLADLADLTQITGQPGEISVVALPTLLRGKAAWNDRPRRLVLLGIGDAGTTAMRTAGATLARASAKFGRVATTVPAAAHTPRAAAAFLEGAMLAAHVGFSAKSAPPPVLTRLGLIAPKGAPTGRDGLQAAARDAAITAGGTAVARMLAATPTSIATSEWIADQAASLATEAGCDVVVRDRAWLVKHGFGGVLAVGAGAATEPRFVVVTHDGRTGRGTKGRTIAVVGKGIAYDTGGLDLKPRESMTTMKTDMSGAAVALGTVLTAARLGLAHRVVAVLPIVENSISGSAYRPGDVVRVYDGTTVEIGNTDAEGRMVLADGLGWAAAELAPDVLIDVATLTGAATMALARSHAAMYATTAELTDGLRRAAEVSGERVWPMPLVADYRDSLTSDVADVSHIQTNPHTKAGSVTAALFLQRFTGDLPWVHLDIAGVGRSTAAKAEIPEGPTGFGVRLLTAWLRALED